MSDSSRQCTDRYKVWLPGHGPRQVFCHTVVKYLYNVDQVRQTFDGLFEFRFQWMLSGAEKERWESNQEKFFLDWKPGQVSVPTALDMEVSFTEPEVELLGNMIAARITQTVKGTFFECLELRQFPFDKQTFAIKAIFPEHDEVFQLHPAVDQPECLRFIQDSNFLTEFRFDDPILDLTTTEFKKLQPDFSTAAVHYPTAILRLPATRSWRGYVNKIIITLSLVSVSMTFGYLIPHDELGDRLAHATTLFLTSAAFQQVVGSSVPNVEYMTLLDKYILSLNLYFVAVMTVMALTFWISQEDNFDGAFAPSAGDIDRYSMIIAFCLWLFIHLVFVCGAANSWNQRLDVLAQDGPDEQLAARTQFCYERGSVRTYLGNWNSYAAALKTSVDQTWWSGVWYSKDFYGPHGREYVYVSVVGDESGQMQLMARKITGDHNVPCGKITWRTTKSLPEIGKAAVPLEVQVRSDTSDKYGFSWEDSSSILAVSRNELQIELQLGPYTNCGTFIRQDRVAERDDAQAPATKSWATTRIAILPRPVSSSELEETDSQVS